MQSNKGRQQPTQSKGTTMTATSAIAVGRAYLMLLRAAKLTLGPAGDDLEAGSQVAITALQLRCLSWVSEPARIPDWAYPATITGCLMEAAAQTPQWDLTALPPEAVDLIIDLADLNHVLGGRSRP